MQPLGSEGQTFRSGSSLGCSLLLAAAALSLQVPVPELTAGLLCTSRPQGVGTQGDPWNGRVLHPELMRRDRETLSVF